jgi:hypothetical protein
MSEPQQVDPRWATLPPSLGRLLVGALGQVSDLMIDTLRHEVPLYRRPLEGSFGEGVKLGVAEALRQFCLMVETGGRGETGGLKVYVGLGAGELRQGRPLEALLAAYRVGARVAWRSFATVGAEQGLSTDQLITLAELVFSHIDSLSAASARGYAEQQSQLAGARDRARQALLRLLLTPGMDLDSITAAAAPAAWRVPRRLLAVVAPAGVPLGVRLGDRALVRDADPVVALVGDPAPTAGLLTALAGTGAVIGPVGGLETATTSRDRAAALLGLRPVLGRTDDAALASDDYLLPLVLRADPDAGADLARRLLAPLHDQAPATRDRLAETLHAWLLHGGERAATAEDLHVHPQTIRYRLGRLRELFGAAVDDPAQRLGLLVALELRPRAQTADSD